MKPTVLTACLATALSLATTVHAQTARATDSSHQIALTVNAARGNGELPPVPTNRIARQ